MNEDNKRENIKQELDRAEEAIGAATLLFDNGFISDAISKLYYFLLYYVRGLLLTKGFESKSHEGALRPFGLHFVKRGLFKPGDSHIFSKLMKYRKKLTIIPHMYLQKRTLSSLKKKQRR